MIKYKWANLLCLVPFFLGLYVALSGDTFYEIEENIDILTDDKVWDIAFNIAREKLLNTLKSDSKIISQKKLNLRVKDSTIEIDVFIKAYENITDYRNIESLKTE